MRKRTKSLRSLCMIGLMVVAVMVLNSCAEGFDNDETFISKVTNSQLNSPELTAKSFSNKVNADGSESVQVTWAVVPGASGYRCIVNNVDDPAKPVEVYSGLVDGTSFLFDKAEDTNYSVSIQTIANTKLGNTDASEPTVYAYSTLVPAQVIPAGSDIVEFVKKNMVDTEDEQAFELEAGASYTINSELDFGMHPVTFRGNKAKRSTVTFGVDGVIRTSSGLKVKFINFDRSDQASNGVIECSSTPYEQLEGPKFGMQDKAYYLKSPILMQECNFRNVHRCLFFTGALAWGIEDVRVNDCIVQLDNDGNAFGNAAVLCTYSGTSYYKGSASWNSAIRNITMKNSTFYNIKDNSKNRAIRFFTNTFSRVFDTNYGSATIENCTFYKVFTGKEFANNTPNRKEYTIKFNHNVTYDCFRLQKFIQNNCTLNVDVTTNTCFGVTQATDGTDKQRCATEEDANFVGPVDQPFDLSQEKGGGNFKAQGAISSQNGDPRWR